MNSSLKRAVDAIARGDMVVLTDDASREDEGDLVFAAAKVTPAAINFMARFGRGLICLTLTGERADALALPMMVAHNTSTLQTAFTVSIEAAQGVTTGISAADRAQTIRVAVNPRSTPADLVRPGHVFPLRARPGGVLERPGQTEGSIDLCRLAQLPPAGVICEIIDDDGTMARGARLQAYAKAHGLPICSVAELIAHRSQQRDAAARES